MAISNIRRKRLEEFEQNRLRNNQYKTMNFQSPAPPGTLQKALEFQKQESAVELPPAQGSEYKPTFREPVHPGFLQAESAKNPTAGLPTTSQEKGPVDISDGTGSSSGVEEKQEPTEKPLTQQELSAQLTTAYTSQMMDQALQSLIDFNNRKFTYKAKESPLYTILQRQSEKEAKLAAGRAYAQSVENAGGYGSTYATLSAEEAARQVMEGKDDQQYALYQAARDEFEAERQSRLDWYSQARQAHSDAMAMEEYEKLEAEKLEKEENGWSETVQSLYNAASQVWDGTNEEQVRSALRNQGATEEEVEKAITMLKEDKKAAVTDRVNQFSISPTLSGATEIITASKQSGNYEEVANQISNTLSKSIMGAMDDLSIGYKVLGLEQEEWESLPDDEKNEKIITAAGEAAKNGMLTANDYYGIVETELKKGLKEAFKNGRGTPISKVKQALDVVSGIISLAENGYITTEQRAGLIDQALKNTDIQETMVRWGEGDVLLNDQINKNQEEAYALLWYTQHGGH